MKKAILVIILVIIVLASFLIYNNLDEEVYIADFQSCANAGHPIAKSLPRQCTTPSGQVFIEELEEEQALECPEGYFPESTNCECAEGYIKTSQAGNHPPEVEGSYKCALDIEWGDLKTCEAKSDCQESYECLSQDIDDLDYRCVPPNYREFDCYCTPESGCVCA